MGKLRIVRGIQLRGEGDGQPGSHEAEQHDLHVQLGREGFEDEVEEEQLPDER